MVKIVMLENIRSMTCIHLENGQKYWLNKEDVISAGIDEGMEVNIDSFIETLRLYQYPKALNTAVSMLARRACSSGEIKKRLRIRHYTDDVADLVIYKLEKERLLNDEEFCMQWIQYRSSMHWGPSRIKLELKYKGIPDSLIQEKMDLIDSATQENNALILAKKCWNKYRTSDNIQSCRQKVIQALVRKGFSWDSARDACRQAEKEE